MTLKKNQQPTESELEILQVLWELGPSTVRVVNDILSQKRDIGYTTTLKLMQIMLEKKLVKRNDKSRTHIYSALANEKDTQNSLLDKFVNATFKGSTMKLVMQALGNQNTSKEELDEIKALINKIEKEK